MLCYLVNIVCHEKLSSWSIHCLNKADALASLSAPTKENSSVYLENRNINCSRLNCYLSFLLLVAPLHSSAEFVFLVPYLVELTQKQLQQGMMLRWMDYKNDG